MSGDSKLKNKVKTLNRNEYLLLYSPAHIEEIAVSTMRNEYPLSKTYEKLEFISKLTFDYELLPFERSDTRLIFKDNIYIYEENPRICYERVVKDYSRNDYAEKVDGEILTVSEEINFYDNDPTEINNKTPLEIIKECEQLISDSFILAMKESYNTSYTSKDVRKIRDLGIKNPFQIFEAFVNVIFNCLEALRYFPEKPTNGRSRLHDVSHAIYGAYCDEFISGDNKLIRKSQVAYKYLGVYTEIIKLKEYVNTT